MTMTLAEDPEVRARAGELLQQVGHAGAFSLERVPGAGNNRVLRVRANARSFLLKSYFRHPDDPRNRLQTEFAFLSLAWQHGLRLLPQPLAADAAHGLGLYEFLEGRRLLPHEIDARRVDEAGACFTAINSLRETLEARRLPPASEACFSIAEHLDCVDGRLQRLDQVPQRDPTDGEGAAWVRAQLHPAWARIKRRVQTQAAASGWALQEVLPPDARRLSPSDFGFHNALLMPDGRLRFVDCEYGGWDDPAKTVCDFYSHPASPVPMDTLPRFQDSILAGLPNRAAWPQRVRLLLPVLRLKWCCIMLNEFLPMDAQRRQYSDGNTDATARKRLQLRKTADYLQRLVLDVDAA